MGEMTTAIVDRNLPASLLATYQPIESEAQIAYLQERYTDAVRGFGRALQFLLDAQIELERGVHKGAVLWGLGLSLLGAGDTANALHNILLAYVEDTLGTPSDYEDNADRAPAARFLIDGFVIQLRLLREIKNLSRVVKATMPSWLQASNPETILGEALVHLGTDTAHVLSLCEQQDLTIGPAPLGFPQPRDRRVFIGTNYDTHSHVIPEMRVAAVIRRYAPIAARDVVVPPNANIHDVSLLLLHTCGYAIFDVTQPAGQFIEIERARDYGVHVLLVRSEPVSHPAHVSQMICSLGYPLRTYRDMSGLRQLVVDFLPE